MSTEWIKKQLYMCLSGTTHYDYIHLHNQKLNRKYVVRLQPRLELLNSHFNSDFGRHVKVKTFDSNGILLIKRAKCIKTANIFQR